MNRDKFMRELSWLLADVPEQERNEALQYYNEYFDDAGADKEAEVISELGTPSQVAKTIRAGLSLPPVVTVSPKTQKTSGWLIFLYIIISIICYPLSFALSWIVMSIVLGAFLTVISLILITLFGAVGLFIGGIILIGSGIGKSFEILMGGLSIVGAGIAVSGSGLLFMVVSLWLAFYVLPWMCKGVGYVFRGGRKGGESHA